MTMRHKLLLFVVALAWYTKYSFADLPETGCGDIDTCITAFENTIGNSFLYDDTHCGAIKTVLKCITDELPKCQDFTEPYSDTYTHSQLWSKFETYCATDEQANTVSAAQSSCLSLTQCISKIQLPVKSKYLLYPQYWCGVAKTFITCDKDDQSTGDTSTCTSTPPTSTDIDGWCPTVDVVTKQFESTSDSKVAESTSDSKVPESATLTQAIVEAFNLSALQGTGCAGIDTCLRTFESQAENIFLYDDKHCVAIDTVLKCITGELPKCQDFTKPYSDTYTHSQLWSKFETYCAKDTDTNTVVAVHKGCTTLTDCMKGVKLPSNNNYLLYPKYWCGVVSAFIACDNADKENGDQAKCTSDSSISEIDKWCPGVDVKTRTFGDDRCDVDNYGCEQKCTSSKGENNVMEYTCSCDEGFKLEGKKCISSETETTTAADNAATRDYSNLLKIYASISAFLIGTKI